MTEKVNYNSFFTAIEEVAKMVIEFNEAVENKEYNKIGQMFCLFREISKMLEGKREVVRPVA